MPSFTEDKLRSAIAAGEIQAISLDTDIFVRYGCNLKIPMLLKLDQFEDSNISIVFSEITAREVERYISRAAEEAKSKLGVSFRNCKKRWNLDFDLDQVLQTIGVNQNHDDLARRQFAKFVEHVQAQIIDVSNHVDINELNSHYFDIKPPFENNSKKKAEFPDAMALLSLETWAKQRNTYVLLVSGDKGWRKFSEKSDNLICVESLEIALDHFNETARSVADEIVSNLQNRETKTLLNEISDVIQIYLDENDFSVNAKSNFGFQKEGGTAILQYWQVPKSTQPHVIAYDTKTITFAVDMECTVVFIANLGIYTYDHEDNKIHTGTEIVSKEENIQISLVLTISREISQEPKLTGATIITQEIEVHFGELEVELGWAYEE